MTFEGPEQGFGGKNCQNGSQGENHASAFFGCIIFRTVMFGLQILRIFMIYGMTHFYLLYCLLQEEAEKCKACEAKKVSLYGQVPSIEKMDASLSTLVACE